MIYKSELGGVFLCYQFVVWIAAMNVAEKKLAVDVKKQMWSDII